MSLLLVVLSLISVLAALAANSNIKNTIPSATRSGLRLVQTPGAVFSEANLQAVNSVIVSRHGIRSPYPPPNGTTPDDVSMYTEKIFPNASDWGMTYYDFTHQELTPHGKMILPLMGAYYRQLYANLSLDISCDKIWVYADYTSGNSGRDVVTAEKLVEGLQCTNATEVRVVTKTNQYSAMAPVLSDSMAQGCPIANEEQVSGLYGGDVNALTEMYADGITRVQKILNMQANATICKNVNPNFDANTQDCTLFETGYQWTGLYFQGEFLSPLYYASYFPEAWMLQYVSNLTNWAFNLISLDELTDLYNLHIKDLSFGTNHWNSQAYSSQQLAYIVASLAQRVKGHPIKGVYQPEENNLLLLVSHDTNIMYLGNLLNLNWIPLGYGNNVASTGGALIFELYQDTETNEFYVKVHYDAASPEQQRNAEVLTMENPPSVATLVIPDCGATYCPWSTFVQIALGSINFDCIAEPLRSTVISMYNEASGVSDDDSSNLTYSDWTLIWTTTSVCITIFVVLAVAGLYLSRQNEESVKGLYEPLNAETTVSTIHTDALVKASVELSSSSAYDDI